MKKLITVILVVILSIPLFALKIGGVELPNVLNISNQDLVLNGAGLRKKFVIRVYACGLYLPQKNDSSAEILLSDEPIAIRMNFIYNKVEQEKLITAWNEGFAKTGALQEFAVETARFNALFNEPAKKGDVYDIVYLPETGVQVIKNKVVLGTIENSDFRRAVFSIWLGDDTALPKLKEDLLNK
ncbi:MAG: chalcone isomerase family protein [Candidatus Stygibacter frigidus]|nr:chalcone isomerase family protein [Candidatus Stygibacter frigidus]